MKKYYQIPEVEVIAMVTSNNFLGENSGWLGPGQNQANEGKTFEADDASPEINTGSPSSLWED